jgi:hypothetical protein
LVLVSGLESNLPSQWQSIHAIPHGLYVPSDRIVKWFAGIGVPNNCRLTLVGNANSFDILDLVTVVYEDVRRLFDALLYGVDDFLRVMFMPSAMISSFIHDRWLE